MSSPSTIDALNQLYVLHHRSLPQYLHYAQPHGIRRNPPAQAVLAMVAADQSRSAERLATMVLDAGGLVDPGEFPMSFTGLHDLSVNYLVKQTIDRQRRHIAVCQRLADSLMMAPYAQAAAREAVGEAKGHLDNLLDLTAEPAAA
jgi:hypothetical protein